MEHNEKLRQYFSECIVDYIKRGQVFDKWFYEKGDSLFFLFKKNLKITNIQYAELISLIKVYATRGDAKVGDQVQFLSVQEFNKAFSELINSFKPNDYDTFDYLLQSGSKQVKAFADDIAQYFVELLKNIIVIDCFYGSCGIYLPPFVKLDIETVCGLSGYIHSCGRNIFTKNVSKTNSEDFINTIKSYVENNEADKRIFFSVYAHEDFSKNDRDVEDDLRNGLDEVKVYVEKYFMGKDSLVSVLKNLNEMFSNSLLIPDAGNYKQTHKIHRQDDAVKEDVSLWLIIDSSVRADEVQSQGASKYYICYEQLYLNDNQLHIFDETKPAWKASTTIPHKLISAMINIGLPNCMSLEKVYLADPFVGTGTSLLESLKYPNLIADCSDYDKFAKILVNDNLQFFSLEVDELKEIKEHLTTISKEDTVRHITKYLTKPILSRLNSSSGGEFKFNEEEIAIIEKWEMEVRFLLYVYLRVRIKSIASIDRGSSDFATAFNIEAKKINKRIDRLIELKLKENNNNVIKGGVNIFQGHYSKATMINSRRFVDKYSEHHENYNAITIKDVRELQGGKYDIIVTDPPYGFNTLEDVVELASLYSEMIRTLIKSLKSDGQIIMSLPDKSYSGKISPYFTHKEVVIQQFLMIAQEEGINKEVLKSVYSTPYPNIFKPPYYWESERALKRSIVYFRLRDRK